MVSARTMRLASQRVARALDASAPSPSSAEVDARVDTLRRLRKQRAVRATRNRRIVASAGALAAVLILAIVVLTRPADLSFTVSGGKGEVGRWIAAPSDATTQIAFSDGSKIDLHAAGRARITEVTERGASVLLEDGTVTADVVHRERTSWTITAGPFDIHVVGTSFDATWSPAEEALTVSMRNGRVEVTGACLDTPRPIEGTEAVRLVCRGVASAVTREETAAPPAPEPRPTSSSAALSATGPVVRSGEPVGSASLSASAPHVSFRELAKRGQHAEAFAVAEREGAFDRTDAASVSELSELAEIARLAGRSDVARRLYLVLRERAAGTDAAALAAFQLGRMTFGSAESERWFRAYLSERPSGALAAEALGRILEIEHRAGRPSARDTAKRYLEQFPNGAHADLARSITQP